MFIGVYSSLEKVEVAKARIRLRPGYRDFPEGFRVDCYKADEDYDDPMFLTLLDPAEPYAAPPYGRMQRSDGSVRAAGR
jgi:hypothetical protein